MPRNKIKWNTFGHNEIASQARHIKNFICRSTKERSLISSDNNYFSTLLNTWKGAINCQPRCPLLHSSWKWFLLLWRKRENDSKSYYKLCWMTAHLLKWIAGIWKSENIFFRTMISDIYWSIGSYWDLKWNRFGIISSFPLFLLIRRIFSDLCLENLRRNLSSHIILHRKLSELFIENIDIKHWISFALFVTKNIITSRADRRWWFYPSRINSSYLTSDIRNLKLRIFIRRKQSIFCVLIEGITFRQITC